MIVKFLGLITSAFPDMRKRLWGIWYQILARRFKQRDWTFMNYGYSELDPEAIPLAIEPIDEPDRYCIQLYHHAASGGEIEGKRVLEVGSGRGGGSSYIARYLRPASMTGVDLSQGAVELSRDRHPVANLQFRQGDSEALPFNNSSFDAVVNVESSHCYPNFEKFLSEVNRVLVPGGFFLWVDFRSVDELDGARRQFAESGMDLLAEREITPNVLRALELDSDRKQAAIDGLAPRFIKGHFTDFAGIRGSKVYEGFKSGQLRYWSRVLRKPA